MRAQIFKVSNWSKLAFFWHPQLGPVTDFDLDQLLTLKNGHFSFFLLLKKCWNTYFIVFFEHQPKFAPKNGPKKKR